MNTQLFIDNVDTFARFGISPGAGAFDELLAFPSLKEPAKNNWPDEEGIEVDLETPCLQPKELSLPFIGQGNPSADDAFMAFLSRPGYHTFRFPALQKEWRLRLLSRSASGLPGAEGGAFTLRLADDFPYRPVATRPEGGGIPLPASVFFLDDIPLDRYALVVEAGQEDCNQPAAVKAGLTRQFAGSDGLWYDTGQVVFDSREVTLRCCLAAATVERFWSCYDALLHALVQPGERRLRWETEGKEYACYYKQTSGFRLLALDGPVVAAFHLTLVFTGRQNQANIAYLLAAEDGSQVLTEDNYLIDITPAAYMPTLIEASLPTSGRLAREASSGSASWPASLASGAWQASEETQFRTRKISEMPEVTSTDNLFVPALHQSTGRNVRLSADLLTAGGGGTGGSGATTLGGLKNVARGADSAADGSILVKKEGVYQPEEGMLGDVEALMAKVFPFTLTLEGGGTFEKGSSQTITLRWEYDRPITAQTLNDETLPISLRTKIWEAVSEDTEYTLSAAAGNLTATRTARVLFRLKKYWGVSAAAWLTDEEILRLHAGWAVRPHAPTRFDCTDGKYPYYILPASLAEDIEFWVGGLRNTDWQAETRPLTNASGHTEPYVIYRLNRIQTGVLNIEIK